MGTLLLPRVALRTGRMLRDWAVVSVEQGLAVDEVSASGAPSPAELAQVWPDVSNSGSVILGAPVEEQGRAIVVRPAMLPPHVENVTNWSVAGSLVNAQYTGRLTRVAAGRFEHRVLIPPEAKVGRVAITHGAR